MKFIAVILSLLLLAGVFVSHIVTAQADAEVTESISGEAISEESVAEEIDVISSNEIEVIDEEQLTGELPEYKEDVEIPQEIQEAEKKATFGITHVTIGTGFVITSDESNAEFFRGIWAVKRLLHANTSKEAENAEIESKRFGFVAIGVGDKKERFKLEAKDFSEESISFDLKDKTGNVAGTLLLKPKKYERLTLWFGELILDSGNYVGTWSVTAIAMTKIIRPKIARPVIWNIFAGGQRKKAVISEKIQERLFEKEGMGKFIKEKAAKNLIKVKKAERTFIVKKAEIVKKRIEDTKKLKPEIREKIIKEAKEAVKKRIQKRTSAKSSETAADVASETA